MATCNNDQKKPEVQSLNDEELNQATGAVHRPIYPKQNK